MVTSLHLPHAIVVRLHVRKSNVVILTPETAVILSISLSLSVEYSIQDEAMDVDVVTTRSSIAYCRRWGFINCVVILTPETAGSLSVRAARACTTMLQICEPIIKHTAFKQVLSRRLYNDKAGILIDQAKCQQVF